MTIDDAAPDRQVRAGDLIVCESLSYVPSVSARFMSPRHGMIHVLPGTIAMIVDACDGRIIRHIDRNLYHYCAIDAAYVLQLDDGVLVVDSMRYMPTVAHTLAAMTVPRMIVKWRRIDDSDRRRSVINAWDTA